VRYFIGISYASYDEWACRQNKIARHGSMVAGFVGFAKNTLTLYEKLAKCLVADARLCAFSRVRTHARTAKIAGGTLSATLCALYFSALCALRRPCCPFRIAPGALDFDGKALRPDGGSAATLIPPAFGLAGVHLHTWTGFGSVPSYNDHFGLELTDEEMRDLVAYLLSL